MGVGAGAVLLVFLFLQSHYAFNYLYEEQFRMFRFSADYAVAAFSRVGGPVEYVTSFLVQFFAFPYVGAAVSAILFGCVAGGVRCGFLRLSGGKEMPLAYWLPGLFFLWAGADFNNHFEAGLAFLSVVWLFALWERLFPRQNGWKVVVALPVDWGLFYLIGPLALLWALAVVLTVLFRKGAARWWSLLLIPGALLAPLVVYAASWSDAPLSSLLTAAAYSHPMLPNLVWVNGAALVWLAGLGLALLFPLCPKGQRPVVRYVSWSVQTLLAGVLFCQVALRANNERYYVVKVLDYYARHGRWTDLLSVPDFRPSENLLHTCYQNLALANMGKLSEVLLQTPQPGAKGLWVEWNKTAPVSALLSDVAYTMGNVALAQVLAFEGLVGCERSENPRLLVRLVQTNLIQGAYPVAEKYIGLLRQTYAYRQVAEHYAAFLYDDGRVEADAELGPLRRCLSKADGLTYVALAPTDLLQVMRSNPSYRPAFEYFGAFCLLTKDLVSFRMMLDEFRTAPVLRPLPRLYQEVVVMLFEGESDRWADYGVEEETIKRFADFRKLFMAARRNPAMAGSLRANFGHTYWYYFMHSKK